MIEFAARAGAFDRRAAMLESRAAVKRAGASGGRTNLALEAARLLG
jgi:porphobilinogen synthase